MSIFNWSIQKNNYRQLIPTDPEFPKPLLEIPDIPKKLYLEGNLSPPDAKILCVVGARKNSHYGEDVCVELIESLANKPVSIVSGLAMGIDTIAHKTAIKTGLHTLAVPGSGLNREVLYPSVNRNFADTIVESGGGLLSEYEPDFVSTQWAFPQRNRIMAGLSHSVLIIEAEKKSGTLITAKLATEYNRNVLTVPGSIYSTKSYGPHMLLRLGATPITCPDDLYEALGFDRLDLDFSNGRKKNYDDCTLEEIKILEILEEPLTRDDLIRKIEMNVSQANVFISLLEMKGHIQEQLGMVRKIG